MGEKNPPKMDKIGILRVWQLAKGPGSFGKCLLREAMEPWVRVRVCGPLCLGPHHCSILHCGNSIRAQRLRKPALSY